MTPRILVLVPMRGGSQRLPGKHVRPLSGATLIERAAKAVAALTTKETLALVSTDDAAIAEAAKQAGLNVPFIRPAELATADASSFSVVVHAINWWRKQFGEHPQLVVLLQATTPFRVPSMIDDAITILENDAAIDAVVGARSLHRTTRTIFTKAPDGTLHRFAQARGEDPLYTVNGSLYAVRTDALLREQTLLPTRIRALVMNDAQSIDIDTPFDWLVAEAVASDPDLVSQ